MGSLSYTTNHGSGDSMTDREELDRSRRKMLVGFLVGFGVWQGMSIARALLGRTSFPVGLAALFVSLAGWAYLCVQLVRMLRWGRRLRRDPELAASLNDERVELARLKSWRVGFFAVLAAQAIPLLAPIPAEVGGRLTILVGVTASIGGYLAFERE
jgi:hypothetical protein